MLLAGLRKHRKAIAMMSQRWQETDGLVIRLIPRCSPSDGGDHLGEGNQD